MRSVMRRTGAAVVWSVLLAGWLSVVSPAWSQVPAGAPAAAVRDPAFDSHLPWIFRERSQIVLEETVSIRLEPGAFGIADADSAVACPRVRFIV